MKKTVPFELFGPNQYIMFDILRLAELETVMGRTIADIATKQDVGVNFCLKALPIGMKQHYRPDPNFYAAKIEEHLENGGKLDDIAVPLVKAVIASGIFGKTIQAQANELAEQLEDGAGKNEMEKTEE